MEVPQGVGLASLLPRSCDVEKLASLVQMPDTAFEFICIWVKVARSSAGWCCPVAILAD